MGFHSKAPYGCLCDFSTEIAVAVTKQMTLWCNIMPVKSANKMMFYSSALFSSLCLFRTIASYEVAYLWDRNASAPRKICIIYRFNQSSLDVNLKALFVQTFSRRHPSGVATYLAQ